jgi:alcohol dehydrogenase (cytochrome c)
MAALGGREARGQEGSPFMGGGAPPPFTEQQVGEGRNLYVMYCAACHAGDMTGGPSGKPLKGRVFSGTWSSRNMQDMFKYLSEKMPPGRTGELTPANYASLIAFMMSENGLKAGATPFPTDLAAMRRMRMPGTGRGRDLGGGLALEIPIPKWPEPANPAAKLTNVTDAMLSNPPPGDWLLWRRTLDGLGFSPLHQIDKRNVRNLKLAWTYTLPPGPNASTSLVHDGVIFVAGSGDVVHALDAATGEFLWRYTNPGRPSAAAAMVGGVKRNMALYEDKLFIATSDNHVVALNAKTGERIWQSPTPSPMSGGPLVVDGVVIQGLMRPEGLGGPKPPLPPGSCGMGGRILGMDAATGKLLWTFNSVPQPGEFGENSWNELPCANRAGGAVWTTGYYDPDLKLIFIGTGNTYDTGPLLKPVTKPGLSADALFTNTTLALDPKTGKRVWHFQHVPGEQWDLDWAFERMIVPLKGIGGSGKAVVTMGKPGILDAMEASTGKYLFSLDPGLQNIIKSIDPVTGRKTYDPDKIPGRESKIICPQVSGGRNWNPSSYNPGSGLLYVPIVEACMVMAPAQPGEFAVLTSGVSYKTAPRPDSDGKIGRLQAFDLKSRKVLWSARQRAPITTGVLATAGGVLFAGSLDREFAAFDDANGKQLWRTRLADVPSGAPISFTANGKQYVAISTGYGTLLSTMFPSLVPEIATPTTASSAIYVFEVN